jgi:lactoylglutathione lyase
MSIQASLDRPMLETLERRQDMFTQAFPIYTTPDLERALRFYRDLLDGKVVYQFPDVEPEFVSLEIGSTTLGIGQDRQLEVPPSRRITLWVYAEDCEAAVDRLRSAGVEITEEPAVQPWGEKVAWVLDPDGNPVIVGEPAPPPGT